MSHLVINFVRIDFLNTFQYEHNTKYEISMKVCPATYVCTSQKQHKQVLENWLARAKNNFKIDYNRHLAHFCNSKKTIKFSIAIKKTECYNHNIKVVKRRSYGSQSRLGNHQWAFILSQCCRTCSKNHSCNLHAMFFGYALGTMRGEMTDALT